VGKRLHTLCSNTAQALACTAFQCCASACTQCVPMLRKRLHILRFNANAMFRHQRNKCQVLLTSARRKHQRFIPGTGPQLDREGPEASQSQLPFQKSDPVHSSHSIKGWPLRRSLMTLWCSSCMLTWPRHP